MPEKESKKTFICERVIFFSPGRAEDLYVRAKNAIRGAHFAVVRHNVTDAFVYYS